MSDVEKLANGEIDLVDFKEKYSTSELKDLAAMQAEAKDLLDQAKAASAAAQKAFDLFRLQLVPEKMDQMGCSSVKIDGLGRVSLSGDLYVSIPTDTRSQAYDWLETHGHGDLIKATINSSTLKAFVKEQIRAGEPIPEDLIKVTPFERASITKA